MTRREVKAHERKLWRYLAWEALAAGILYGGNALEENRLSEFVIPIGILLTAVAWFRALSYLRKDLRLRGLNPFWPWLIGGASAFPVWLLMRRSHPIPTEDGSVA